MSHPVPTHDYSERTYPDAGGVTTRQMLKKQSPKSKALKKKMNPAQRSMHKLFHSVNTGGRKEGEAPLQHLKRLIK